MALDDPAAGCELAVDLDTRSGLGAEVVLGVRHDEGPPLLVCCRFVPSRCSSGVLVSRLLTAVGGARSQGY